MKQKITKSVVNALPPRTCIWDTQVIGFGVRRQKDSISYIVKTRIRGRQRLITIGRHGSPWTPEQARREARRLLGLIAQGMDPAEEKRRERARKTVDEIWKEFVSEHVSKLKPRTREEYLRLYRLHIAPYLGRKKLAEIDRDHVATLHRQMRHIPRSANFCLAVISSLMSWSEERGYRSPNDNPVKGIRKYRETHRDRFLTREEIRALGKALDAELAEHGNIHVVSAIRLLILTGARLNEILTLQWQHVDLENGLLMLPESKTGRKVILLNKAAREILEGLPREAGNPYVICGHKEGRHLVNLQKPWRRIRKRAGLDDVRLHDLRHTFASLAARKGGSLPKIGALLGHSQVQTTQRYAHLVPGDLKELADMVGEAVADALND